MAATNNLSNALAMEMRPGSRWHMSGATTEVVVIRSPTDPVTLSCAGLAMEPLTADRPNAELGGAPEAATLIGKRYVDQESGLEVLCTRSGPGPLTAEGRLLAMKTPKPLPSSD
jgi:hypothetical protein